MLSAMDRRSRVLWQEAAARQRQWYADGGRFGAKVRGRRSWSVVVDVRFGHRCLLMFAKSGDAYDPYWWA